MLGEIADGSKPAAESLQKMRASGADVRMARYNYVEATHGEAMRAGARKLIVQELRITIDEGGGLASRRPTYEELSAGKPAAVQPKDVPMIGAVKAAGPDAELWSFDGGVKENARRFGMRMAPESGLRGAKIPKVRTPNVRAGLDNVGLQSWDVTTDGTPLRRPAVAPGAPAGKAISALKGGSASTSQQPAPTSPPARTVIGEIGGATRPGGGAPPGKGTPLLTTEAPASTTTASIADSAKSSAGRGVTVRGVLKVGTGLGIQMVAFWWLGTKAAKAEADSRAKLLAANVDPEVNKILKAQAGTAERLTRDDPSHPVYANVVADFDYTWTTSGIGGTPSSESVTDIRFVRMTISREKVENERLLKEEDYAGFSQIRTHWATRQVIFSIEVDFGESEAEHHWRMLVHDAGQVARRRMSARSVAEGTQWGGKELRRWEQREDEQRRRWNEPTLAEQRAYDERELWVRAYIEYTAFHGPDDQYIEAIRYLEEIQRRPRPVPVKPMRIR